MTRARAIKTALVASWAVGGLLLVASDRMAGSAEAAPAEATPVDKLNPDDVVGSDTCKQCHEKQHTAFSVTPHAKIEDTRLLKDKEHGCESCHGGGRAHVEAAGDKTKIVTFAGWSSKKISDTCMQCHAGQGEEHFNFRRGEHWRNDVGCTDCHTVHSNTPAQRPVELTHLVQQSAATQGTNQQTTDPRAGAMLRQRDPQLCISCHTEARSQFTMPFHHKVLEGGMSCSDCHNPHGGHELKQERLALGTDSTCVSCHSDKQGPFVFEHAPIKVEGCSACHTPHGAANPKLLKRNSMVQLCIECHSNAHDIGGPNTPSFHNLATARFQNCTTCHTKIHGSNAHPFFFE